MSDAASARCSPGPVMAEAAEAGTLRARVVDGTVLADRLRVAQTHWTRLRGLLGRRALAAGEGLWIRPCRQVHMFGMRYPLDVVFLDDGGRVVGAVAALRPNRISPKFAAAASVLELPVGTIARGGLEIGAQVEVDGAGAGRDRLAGIGAALGNLFVAAMFALFAAVHVAHVRRTGEWATVAPILAQETLLIGLFLTRRRSTATSTRPLDWAIGLAGTLLPLCLRIGSAAAGRAWVGAALQIAGLLWVIAGALSLGRSIAIVPCNRGIRGGGLYRLVRHPMYTGYVLSGLGYLAAYPTARNGVLVAATAAALAYRASAEERLLATDPTYDAYRARVRWRFVPYLF